MAWAKYSLFQASYRISSIGIRTGNSGFGYMLHIGVLGPLGLDGAPHSLSSLSLFAKAAKRIRVVRVLQTA